MKLGSIASSLVAFATLATLGVGCGSGRPDADQRSTPPPPTPPSIDEVTIADYPPIGPHGQIQVRVTDDEALMSLRAVFRKTVIRSIDGTNGAVSLSGPELGEGMGTLRLVACDVRSSCRSRDVTNLLVDMTPPEIDGDRLVASPTGEGLDGQISFWVADAWVLGNVEMTFKGKTFRHEFPKAYPSTLGTAWDVSRVAFLASELGEGDGTAIVKATDAAGNTSIKELSIRVDGTPPIASILVPAPNAAVSGTFPVRIAASDPGVPTPVTIELSVGGAPIADLAGPLAEVEIDASTLPPGPTRITAVAIDEAGNRSAAATVTVNLQ